MRYLIPLCCCFYLVSCKTVEENKKVEINFANPTYPAVTTIKPKQTLEIILQNVNPYLFDISLKDSLIVYQIEQPKLLGQIFKLPELSSVPAKAPASDSDPTAALPKNSSKAAQSAKAAETALETELNKFISDYPGKEIAVKDILILSKVPDDIGKLLEDCYSTLNELKVKADAYIADKLPAVNVQALPLGIDTEIRKNSADVRADITQYTTTGEELKKKHQAVLDQSDPKMPLSEYKIVEKNIKTKIASIDKILENSKKLMDKLTEFDDAKVGLAIEGNYKKVMTSRMEKTFLISTQYRTDEVSVIIDVKKKKDIVCAKETGRIPVVAVVAGGVKIDFSTGFVFNFGRQNFFDQKYYYDSVIRNNVVTDSVVIKRSHNNNVTIPSLGAFFHVYSRMSNSVNYGGMLGASLGSDQRAYFHVGGCILIGKSDRLVIGGGVSVANAKTLDGQYSEGQAMKRSLAPTSVPTEIATRIGGYLSVTWNLNLLK